MSFSVLVSDAVIDSSDFQQELHSEDAHGAVLTFYGIVRETNLGRKVDAVSYDGFVPLAEKTLSDICREVESRWGDMTIRIVHRLGKLSVGEVSVAIGVSTPRRDPAYEASRYLIEQLKVRLPVWKKEHYVTGESEWLRGHSLNGASNAIALNAKSAPSAEAGL